MNNRTKCSKTDKQRFLKLKGDQTAVLQPFLCSSPETATLIYLHITPSEDCTKTTENPFNIRFHVLCLCFPVKFHSNADEVGVS